MDNLRKFLASHCRKRHAVSAKDAWEQLTQKLNDLKEQDLDDDRVLNTMKAPYNKIKKSTMRTDLVVTNCIKVFREASHKSCHPFATPPAESKAVCDAAVQDLKILSSQNLLCRHEFVTDLIHPEVTIPLQLIWQLHKGGILQISTYVFRRVQPGDESLVSSAVLWLITHSKESSEHFEVAVDTLASLLVASQSGPLNFQLSSICSTVLKKCTEDIVNWVVSLPQACSSAENSINFIYLTSPKLWSCGVEAMEQYVLAHLLFLLNEQCVFNSTEALMNAVSVQEKATFKSLTPSFQNLLLSIINALGVEKVIYKLGAAVVESNVSWKVIFFLVAALLSNNPDCYEDLGKLIDELVEHGLEAGSQTELCAGILLARQCCCCDSKNFGSYSTWFSSHFGPDSVTARNPTQFQLLLKLLTQIVPAESAEILRVHINKVPQAPTLCNSVLHDYTVLARTRLADLNESSELTGLFSDNIRDAFPGLDSRQRDIVKVLQHFQQTGEVMKPIIEASIFRRQYYRNVFLVELLGLPGSAEDVFKPENFELNSEVQHKFILALKSMGKIPDKLFQSYSLLNSSQEVHKCDAVEFTSRETVVETKTGRDQPRKKKSLKVQQKKQ